LDHQVKEITTEELFRMFPEDLLERYKSFIKKMVYGIVSLYEISLESKTEKEILTFADIADICTKQLMEFVHMCYTKINESFLLIFGKILKESLQAPFNAFWHNCDKINLDKDPHLIEKKEARHCSCTVLGCLFRVGNIMPKDQQQTLYQILIECFKDQSFKEFLAIEYTKYIPFLYTENYTGEKYEDIYNSKLVKMQLQLYQKDEVLVQIIKSGYFSNFIALIKKGLHYALQVNYELYFTVADLKNGILSFLLPRFKCGEELIHNSNMMNELLETMMTFEIKFFYPGKIFFGIHDHQVNYISLNTSLMIEKVLCQPFLYTVRNICKNLPHNEKMGLMAKIFEEWFAHFQTAKEIVDDEIKNGMKSFNPIMERVFCSALKNCLDNISKETTSTFLNQVFSNTKSSYIAEKVIEGLLRALGMVRYLHVVHNYKSGKLWNVYYFLNNIFFETDILSIQMMAQLVKPEILFETLATNFFSFCPELQEVLKNPDSTLTGKVLK